MPAITGMLKKRIAKRFGGSSRQALRTVVTSALVAALGFGGMARAATLYWDTDGSTSGNNVTTGANLGGSGIWNAANSNWWDTSVGTLQPWTDGNDAVFWGTAGAVTAS